MCDNAMSVYILESKNKIEKSSVAVEVFQTRCKLVYRTKHKIEKSSVAMEVFKRLCILIYKG